MRIQNLPDKNLHFRDFYALYECLNYHYGQVLKKLNVIKRFSMKTIRCYYATEWVKKRRECLILQKTVPPNPLQHLKPETTIYYYAATGSDSAEEAKKRLHH